MNTREIKQWRGIGSMLAVAALAAGCGGGGGSAEGLGSAMPPAAVPVNELSTDGANNLPMALDVANVQIQGQGHFGGASIVSAGLQETLLIPQVFGMTLQQATAVAPLSSGNYVLAWSVVSKTTIYVYAQEFDRNGAKVGSTKLVSNWGEDPAIAALSDGGYVVTWESLGSIEEPGHDIMAQRFDSGGAKVGDAVRVNTTTAGAQLDPEVAALAGGGYAVTWSSQQLGSPSGPVGTVFAQRYDSAGAPVGGETKINTSGWSTQDHPDVTALNDGGYVVTWVTVDGDSTNLGVFARRYDSSGAAVSGETRINTTTAGGQWEPAIATLSDGGHVIAWSGWDGSSSYEIYTQRFDAAGVPVGGETRVNTTTSSDQHAPTITALADGGYAVTWQSLSVSSSWDVYAQRFDGAGAPVGGELPVTAATAGTQSHPVITGLSDGSFVDVWWDARPAGTPGLYARRFENALLGGDGRDWLATNEAMHVLLGAGGDDRLYGSAGNDTLDGGTGDDFMAGGAGDDTYIVDSARDKVMERAGEGHDTVMSSVSYALERNVEDLVLTGNAAIDGAGNDLGNRIVGNAAANRLAGGAGNDTLDGGAGPDTIVFDARLGPDNVDVLMNFAAAQDMIELDARIFKALPKGPLSADVFQYGSAAGTAGHRITYDPATGALMYDPDGTGSEPAVQIATLGLTGTLSAANFVVV